MASSTAKSLAVTVAVAAVILIAALVVLTAIAGQQSGLEKSTAGRCTLAQSPAAHALRSRNHRDRRALHARCTTSQDG